MASSGKPTAVHFSLIVFVGLTVISTAVAIFMWKDNRDSSQKWADAVQAERDVTNQLRNRVDEIDDLKKLIGHLFDSIGLDDVENPNTVLGAMAADIKLYGRDVQQPTYSATIIKLREALDAAISTNNALTADVKEHANTIASLRGDMQVEIDGHKQSREKAEGDLTTVQSQQQEKLDTKDAENSRLRTELAQLNRDYEQDQETFSATLQQTNANYTRLASINDVLRDENQNMKNYSFETPDGVIRWVDHVEGLVWINLGQADGLVRGTTFSVYTKAHHGVGRNPEEEGRGPEDITGAIQVTMIRNAHLAEARILENKISEPFAPGDPIYTPLWSPGRREAFSVVGLLDLDGDGNTEGGRKLFHELVTAAGATIDNEVDDQGNLTGDGISVATRFLVIGKMPDPADEKDPEKAQIYLAISEQHKKLIEQARLQGTKRVNLSAFLDFIGYRPQRRLWRPGESTQYNLKYGALSKGVGGTIGNRNRKSSGQTSGLYSRSRRLRQPTSSGQTSKFYGGRSSGN